MAAEVDIKLNDKTKAGADSARKNIDSILGELTSKSTKFAKFGLQTIALQGGIGVVKAAVGAVMAGVDNLAAKGNPAAKQLAFSIEQAKDSFTDWFSDPTIQAGMLKISDFIKKDLVPLLDSLPKKAHETAAAVDESSKRHLDGLKRIFDSKYRNEPAYQPTEENAKALEASIESAQALLKLKAKDKDTGDIVNKIVMDQLKRDMEALELMKALLNGQRKFEGKEPYNDRTKQQLEEIDRQHKLNIERQRMAAYDKIIADIEISNSLEAIANITKETYSVKILTDQKNEYYETLKKIMLTNEAIDKSDAKNPIVRNDADFVKREKQRLASLIQMTTQRIGQIEREKQAFLKAEIEKQQATTKTDREKRSDSMNRFNKSIKQPQFNNGFLANPFAGMFPVRMGGLSRLTNRHATEFPDIPGMAGEFAGSVSRKRVEREAKQRSAYELKLRKADIFFARDSGDKAATKEAQRAFKSEKAQGWQKYIGDALRELASKKKDELSARGIADQKVLDAVQEAANLAIDAAEKDRARGEAADEIKKQVSNTRSKSQRMRNR